MYDNVTSPSAFCCNIIHATALPFVHVEHRDVLYQHTFPKELSAIFDRSDINDISIIIYMYYEKYCTNRKCMRFVFHQSFSICVESLQKITFIMSKLNNTSSSSTVLQIQ